MLTWFAFIVTSLVPISIAWGEYYAIPGELLAGVLIYGIGWLLSRGESEPEETTGAQVLASAAIVWLVVGLFSTLPLGNITRTCPL